MYNYSWATIKSTLDWRLLSYLIDRNQYHLFDTIVGTWNKPQYFPRKCTYLLCHFLDIFPLKVVFPFYPLQRVIKSSIRSFF